MVDRSSCVTIDLIYAILQSRLGCLAIQGVPAGGAYLPCVGRLSDFGVVN